MLQQTQVDRVVPKYRSFLKKFPDAKKLANASVADVLKEWKGLGYNRRALHLKRAAEMIEKEFKGKFPKSVEDIEKFPGVGKYTARAIATFAWNEPHIFIETNIRRIFIHFFFKKTESVHDNDIVPYVKKTLYAKNPRLWYSALMDYGSGNFKQVKNPNRKSRHYMKQSKFEGSSRAARSHILQHILYKERVTFDDMAKFFANDPEMGEYGTPEGIKEILEAMKKEGLVYERDGRWQISPL